MDPTDKLYLQNFRRIYFVNSLDIGEVFELYQNLGFLGFLEITDRFPFIE